MPQNSETPKTPSKTDEILEDLHDFFKTNSTSNPKPGMSSKDGLRSVFTTKEGGAWEERAECVPDSRACDDYGSILTAGYFTVTNTKPEVHKSRQPDPDGTFWQIIVTSMTEEHAEKFALHNSLCDSIVVHATGAKPISVLITGYLLYSKTDDHAYLFLQNYTEYFRARVVNNRNTHLHFVLKDTEFDLLVENITLGHAVEMETYVSVTISGIAYHYRMSESTEILYKGYLGKGRSVAATKRDLLESDEAEKSGKEEDDVSLKQKSSRTKEPEKAKTPGTREPTSPPYANPEIDPYKRQKAWEED